VIIDEKDHLAHYGTPRHSGRYPWGSGGNAAATRNRDFTDSVEMMRQQGLSDKQIYEGMGLTSSEFRARLAISTAEQRIDKIHQAQRLADTGMSVTAVGREMGINESSVRALLAPGAADKANVIFTVANMLEKEVEEKGVIDIGSGVANTLDVTQTKLNNAVSILKEKGYAVHTIPVPNLSAGGGKQTSIKTLSAPGTTWGDVARNKAQIKQIGVWTEDGGRTPLGLHPPMSIDPSRIKINHAEEGGTNADGVIYVRPGVEDVNLGGNRYAQVRVAVGGTHYLKGMAIYRDDLPDGVDLVFNTNKSNKLPMMHKDPKADQVLKPMKVDPATGKIDKDNPFGAQLKRQIVEVDAKGKETLKSSMNIIHDEGDWENWSRALSSQILSKQSPELAKGQLDMTYERRKQAYEEISALTNPAVKKKLLEGFADGADSAAVHLKAATLPKSAYQVILPIQSIKPTEVYAPNFKNGERVALIRSPHGGTFEIPELTVNNRNQEGIRNIKPQARDAIGIHPRVAERLSGADFDGDFVIVVPNDRGHIKSTPALEGLKGFDPKHSYPGYEGMIPIGKNQQAEMGKITNLIADMTIRGANNTELAAAVRHSMVVIDADKHNLDYRASAKANNIAQLKERYQGRSTAGASTIVTRASSEYRIPERRLARVGEGGPIDKATGKKVYVETGKMVPVRNKTTDPVTGKTVYVDTGETKLKTQKVKKLSVYDDAHDPAISSGQPIEMIYADYSNQMKALANAARRDMVNTKTIPYSPSAKAAYSNEVASLNAKLNAAIKNRPLERQAQVIGNATYSQKLQANPDMDDETKKKVKRQAINEARRRTGADKHRIDITEAEWNAIQAGAISNHRLEEILTNTDIEVVQKLATPPTPKLMTPSKLTRAKHMADLGFTQAEIAEGLGVSLTTLKTSMA
jgi:hypothetical protein